MVEGQKVCGVRGEGGRRAKGVRGQGGRRAKGVWCEA